MELKDLVKAHKRLTYEKVTAAAKYAVATNEVARLKGELERLQAEAMVNKQVSGSNSDERKAASALLFPEVRAALEAAEADKVMADADLKITRYNLESLEVEIRALGIRVEQTTEEA